MRTATIALVPALLAAAPLFAPSPALAAADDNDAAPPSPSVYHVPIAETETGDALTITAEVARGWSETLQLRYRAAHAKGWDVVEFERASETRYTAVVPADKLAPPAIEYYIASAAGAHFASASSPHPVRVREPARVVQVARELERFDHRRARIRAAAEYVDFGRRQVNGQSVADRYYRLEVDFTYRVLALPLRAFRLGFTQMLGETPAEPFAGACPDNDCELSAGFRVGGFAELRWRLAEHIDVDSRVLIQATPDGFGFGGRGELRFGDETATHFSLGAEAITEVGSNAFVRLGWATVPRFPMAATIELTDYPASSRPHGVRLVYDVGYELGRGVRAGGRVGYQARDEGIGGVSGGLNATVDF